MTNQVKPQICRTNKIKIPVNTEDCMLWLNPVKTIEDIKNPTRDYAWITPDNTVYVYNGHKIVPIFSTDDSHIQWGHLDGDIKDQTDLYNLISKTVNGVKQNGTEMEKDLEQKVNVSVPIMHIKVNDTELEPSDYTVDIDLTTYAKTSDIPINVSQLANDAGYVTPETINVPIKTITVNGSLLTPDEHKNVVIEVPTKTSQLTNDLTFQTKTQLDEAIATALSSVYRYAGSVENRTLLPTENQKVGDVYNLQDTGMNTAWDGEKWNDLGTTIDLSIYATYSYVNEIKEYLLNKLNNFIFSQVKTFYHILDNLFSGETTTKTVTLDLLPSYKILTVVNIVVVNRICFVNILSYTENTVTFEVTNVTQTAIKGDDYYVLVLYSIRLKGEVL